MSIHGIHNQATPDTIETIIDQLGGRGLSGALVYVGASRLAYKCAEITGEYRSGYQSKLTEQGCIDFAVGLSFSVNGKRGQGWTMVVAYEPDDTYSVWLWRRKRVTVKQRLADINAPIGEALDHREDVYCMELKRCVEEMYDSAIKKHNGGFIPC